VHQVLKNVRKVGDDAREKFKQMGETSSFFRPDELVVPLRTMLDLMEIEGMLVALNRTSENVEQQVFDDMEHSVRGIRDSVGRIVANSIVLGIHEAGHLPEEYGVIVTQRTDERGFTLEIPYEMISMSDLFMLRSKKIAALQSLFTVRQAWVALVSAAARRLKLNNSMYPLHRASVHVTIQIQGSRPLDPDHFWVRPVLDGLVESGLIVNDDAEIVSFMLDYQMNRERNSVVMEVTLQGN